jgi:hypothetical protein
MEKPWTEAADGTYLVQLEGAALAIKCAAPLVLARVEIGPVPPKGHDALFRRLLELNAGSLVHAAYGLDHTGIVLSAALELENLDYNELDAVVAEFDLALSQHLPQIRDLAGVSDAAKAESARDAASGKGGTR